MIFKKSVLKKYEYEINITCKTEKDWCAIIKHFYSKGIIFFQQPKYNHKHVKNLFNSMPQVYLYVVVQAKRLYYGTVKEGIPQSIDSKKYLKIVGEKRYKLLLPK